jgi:hypothetical protein
MDMCPHEVLRLLIQNSDSAPKKVALVTEQGVPVAVVPLKQLGRWQYEVSTWMIPGTVFPVKPGYLVPTLESLGIEVWVSWRRMESLPPQGLLTRYLEKIPVHILDCSVDFERYWRENGYFKTIRNKRNRCKDFNVAINSSGSAEWTIKNAAKKWREHSTTTNRATEDWVISDLLTAAKYWEERGRHYTIQLLDQDVPIGGATMWIHQNEAVGGMIYRKEEYEWHGVGDRLLDLSASFAAEHGLGALDFGGGAAYKEHWAPQISELWQFNVCPEPLFRVKQTLSWTRTTQEKLFNRIRSGETQAVRGNVRIFD